MSEYIRLKTKNGELISLKVEDKQHFENAAAYTLYCSDYAGPLDELSQPNQFVQFVNGKFIIPISYGLYDSRESIDERTFLKYKYEQIIKQTQEAINNDIKGNLAYALRATYSTDMNTLALRDALYPILRGILE